MRSETFVCGLNAMLSPTGNSSMPGSDSAPAAVAELLLRANAARASDIHLQMNGNTADVSFRLDGVLTSVEKIPAPLAERVFGRIKYLARLKTYQDSLPQDGRIERSEINLPHDVRVSTYPTVCGEKIVLRLFHESGAPTLQDLNLSPLAQESLATFLSSTSGLLLLTGPAGSGKTTTIYACLQHLAQLGGRHIITVEDPVEQVLPGIMQTEVNEASGLTFGKAARHLLRQDPQVLVVGEIRDDETAQIAVRAALTGHMVVSTLHAGSCRGVVERLLTMCPDRFALFSSLRLILNQRLIRKLCPPCRGEGCPDCLQTGYKGRIPVVECVALTPEISSRLRIEGSSAIFPSISLSDEAHRLVREGITTSAEAKRVI